VTCTSSLRNIIPARGEVALADRLAALSPYEVEMQQPLRASVGDVAVEPSL